MIFRLFTQKMWTFTMFNKRLQNYISRYLPFSFLRERETRRIFIPCNLYGLQNNILTKKSATLLSNRWCGSTGITVEICRNCIIRCNSNAKTWRCTLLLGPHGLGSKKPSTAWFLVILWFHKCWKLQVRHDRQLMTKFLYRIHSLFQASDINSFPTPFLVIGLRSPSHWRWCMV